MQVDLDAITEYRIDPDAPDLGDWLDSLAVTIDYLEENVLVGEGADAEQKPLLHFVEDLQPLVLNKTNATSIAELHGEDYTRWRGKKITLYPTRVQFGSKMVDAIRVRETSADDLAAQDKDVF